MPQADPGREGREAARRHPHRQADDGMQDFTMSLQEPGRRRADRPRDGVRSGPEPRGAEDGAQGHRSERSGDYLMRQAALVFLGLLSRWRAAASLLPASVAWAQEAQPAAPADAARQPMPTRRAAPAEEAPAACTATAATRQVERRPFDSAQQGLGGLLAEAARRSGCCS